jgi:hypothetical protein
LGDAGDRSGVSVVATFYDLLLHGEDVRYQNADLGTITKSWQKVVALFSPFFHDWRKWEALFLGWVYVRERKKCGRQQHFNDERPPLPATAPSKTLSRLLLRVRRSPDIYGQPSGMGAGVGRLNVFLVSAAMACRNSGSGGE